MIEACRNPFVNQVFGVLNHFPRRMEIRMIGRNPFVNQVFGVLCGKFLEWVSEKNVAIPS